MASAGASGFGDGAVEQRNAVPALEVGGVGQHEVGVGDGLGEVGVGVDDLGDLVVAGGWVLVSEMRQRGGQVHRRVPAHVGHVQEQHIDGVGIAAGGVGDHHVHEAVGGERSFPAEGLVDALRRAGVIDEEVVGPGREAQMRAGQRLAGDHVAELAARLEEGGRLLGVGRLVAEAAGTIDGAEQDLQDVQDARGVEAVGVGRDAAHGVHADGAADHLVVPAAVPVGPGDVEGDLLLEGGMRQLGGDAADGAAGTPLTAAACSGV